jgi:hypothetical protein
MRTHPTWRLLPAGCVSAAALALGACTSLATQPGTAQVTMAGEWQQDKAASEDFDGKLATLLRQQRERMRPKHGRGDMGGGRGGEGGSDGDDRSGVIARINELDALAVPLEEADKVRARLGDELRPPMKLHIEISSDAVEITGDADPPRRFLPGQSVSRIDVSGAASLSSGWDQDAFVVRAKYTNRGERSWRYELEPSGGALRLSMEAQDPEFGNFKLQTRYRRAASNP